jgi:hypothetical protein
MPIRCWKMLFRLTKRSRQRSVRAYSTTRSACTDDCKTFWCFVFCSSIAHTNSNLSALGLIWLIFMRAKKPWS